MSKIITHTSLAESARANRAAAVIQANQGPNQRHSRHFSGASRPVSFLVLTVLAVFLVNGQTTQKLKQQPISTQEDVEARDLARRLMQRMLLKCGDSYYGYLTVGDFIDARRVHGLPVFAQVKLTSLNIEVIVAEPPLAERLNGLKQRGYFRLRGDGALRVREWRNDSWGPWKEWIPAPVQAEGGELKKINDTWFVELSTGEPDIEHKPVAIADELGKKQATCADLPISADAGSAYRPVPREPDTPQWWTDLTTALMWSAGDYDSEPWRAAENYCSNLALSGHKDWRLPEITELESAPASIISKSGIDPNSRPRVWSSTKSVMEPSEAWYFNFSANQKGTANLINPMTVLCVRRADP